MNELLKCLIVDDEHLLRELLKRAVDWELHGMSLAAEASSAMEAFDLVEEIRPDIIFADICMPVINGLDFASSVLARHPHIRIIFLTGHDEFEYARRGLKMGAADFLLKPINPAEINRTLSGVCGDLRKEMGRLREYEQLKRSTEENRPFMRERFLNGLVTGEGLPAEPAKLDYYGIAFGSDDFQAALLEPEPVCGGGEEESLLFLQYQCAEYLKGFPGIGGLTVFSASGGRIVLINNDSSTFQTDFYENIKENLSGIFDCLISIGVGPAVRSLDSLPVSYSGASEALCCKIIEGRGNVIHFGDINTALRPECRELPAALGEFAFYLSAGALENALEVLEEIMKSRGSGAIRDITAIQIPAVNILSRILNVVRESGIGIEIFGRSLTELYNGLLYCRTLPEMIECLTGLASIVAGEINRNNCGKTGKLISDVKAFLESSYCDPELTLNSTAAMFNVNSSYLSRKFSTETGSSFSDYLSHLRLSRAVTLLQRTDKKNYEISDEVGIADPHYFSIFFRKHMGMSISEYRKRINT